MREKLSSNYFLCFLILVLLTIGCSRAKDTVTADADKGSHQQYTCPMHPQVLRNKRGSCPICGMDLVPRVTTATVVKISPALKDLLKSPNESVITPIPVVTPASRSLSDTLRVPAILTVDSRNLQTVAARVGGRVEQLYLKYEYQPVRKGQKLLEIYSPELVAAQREYLYILRADRENNTLREQAKERLYLLGMSKEQVARIARDGKEQYTFAIYSPASGYLIGQDQSATGGSGSSAARPAAAGGMGGMSGGQPVPAATPGAAPVAPAGQGGALLIREGSYVASGQPVFRIVDPSKIWAEVSLPDRAGQTLKKGDRVVMLTGDGSRLAGTVELLQPFYSGGTQFRRARISLSNPTGTLRIGQLAELVLVQHLKDALTVPASAILDLGTRKVAFVKTGRVLTAKTVVTGKQIGNWTEVKGGLAATDSLAANAQFLVDSEGFIKTNQ